ncbi:D-mannonate dehydratase ManD [Cellulomonas fimi]|uniref:Mandelate racemase/muconate lactonizing protein n=1 Tax=Cellulomonas fimi (strain ATCC 484 / DSM 20113 / JCM 1341 / CCUG 24087 / LMG 16345 / NBRC 15513 / NCIMB 8980 / NCTC 7547 / NRS-133) TaxID=590998 RepID=F4H112_CELFA|nr:D-mannonate dehydratase ManD [Cellulomonas fimi]AEE47381.1 Mandelate racemase/muconate lactonizing protein [Cellulomonas fimi ATCC 484]
MTSQHPPTPARDEAGAADPRDVVADAPVAGGEAPTTPTSGDAAAPTEPHGTGPHSAPQRSGSAIRSAEVLVSSPDRNFVTLRVTTEDGVVGLGDATLNGRELSVVSYLRDHVVPLLIGRDAHRIEDTWQFLYRSAYWRRGPVTMAAIAAVDVALWDIKARYAGMPLYQLLGGASRTGIMAYGHASGRDLPELFDSIRHHQELGFRSIRVQTAVPGIDKVYGIAAQHTSTGSRYDYEPAQRIPLPAEEDWDTRAYLRHLPRVFEAVRHEFGPELPLLHDGHHRMTPIQAARLGKDLEPYDLFWLEDCTPAENQDALRLVRQHTTTPLAIGEVFNTVWDYQTLVREQLVDYVRSAVTHTGGITALRRILDFAAQYQIKSGIHGPTDISPVGMAAALHLDLAIHNFGIQEYMPHGRLTDEVFRQSFTFTEGFLHPGDAPGLGVVYDDAVADRFPYQPAYLPFNRLKDGTVHDW